MIRQFGYYAKLESSHPLYIADSSNDENSLTLKRAIREFENRLTINYTWYSPGPDNHGNLLEQVKEKYACVISDDDYQIPSSLTKCAQFLESNPDYGAAGGYAVSFRLDKSGPYGNLKRLADYPRYSIESTTAKERLIDFMKVVYSITFFVNRVENMKKAWESRLFMAHTLNELISWNQLIVAGKAKLIDCLGLVRQIHDKQYPMPTSFDWMISKGFVEDYNSYKNNISAAIAEKDNINVNEAGDAAKEAFWDYMQRTLAYDYKYYIAQQYPPQNKYTKNFRTEIGKSLPFLKRFYRAYVRPFLKKGEQIHYEVTNPHSLYYNDFKPVLDSFTGKDIKNI